MQRFYLEPKLAIAKRQNMQKITIIVMKILNLVILFSFVSCTDVQPADSKGQLTKAEALEKTLHQRDPNSYRYATKFGNLKFVLGDESLGTLAKTITLDDKTLINVKGEKDAQGNPISLMTEIMQVSGTESEPRISGKMGPKRIKRMIVLVGPDGNCVKHFVILDFTGKQPFVSERFGDNPQDQSCLSFKRAKWGKSESYIYLEGPMTYIYYTGGRVIGPI